MTACQMLGLRRKKGGEPREDPPSYVQMRCSHPTVVFFMSGFGAADSTLIEGFWHCEICGRRFIPEPEEET